MFTNERPTSQNEAKIAKNAVVKRGTTLASPKIVNPKFTYKELTLVLGIFVAMLVALTVWAAHKENNMSSERNGSTLKISTSPIDELIKRSTSIVRLR